MRVRRAALGDPLVGPLRLRILQPGGDRDQMTGRPKDARAGDATSFKVGDWLAVPTRDLLIRGPDQVKIEPRSMEVLRRLALEGLRLSRDGIGESEVQAEVRFVLFLGGRP